jgi:dienelactone hydrolase
VTKETFEYQDQGKVFEAFVAKPDRGGTGKNPAVLVFHAWRGRDAFACQKAEALAKLGYVGVALDLYGKGVLAKNNEESGMLMQPLVKDRALLRKRILIALDATLKRPEVDSHQIGAIGFCFGGLCALDLARTGADVKGVATFHGLFDPPEGVEKKTIRAKILAMHGHDDPMAPPEKVLAFEKEMTQAKVDWQVHVYGNTMHAFTVPEANDPGFGTVYQPLAERRSWQSMKNFFEEVFG